jgi:hypothetical protein
MLPILLRCALAAACAWGHVVCSDRMIGTGAGGRDSPDPSTPETYPWYLRISSFRTRINWWTCRDRTGAQPAELLIPSCRPLNLNPVLSQPRRTGTLKGAERYSVSYLGVRIVERREGYFAPPSRRPHAGPFGMDGLATCTGNHLILFVCASPSATEILLVNQRFCQVLLVGESVGAIRAGTKMQCFCLKASAFSKVKHFLCGKLRHCCSKDTFS